MIPKTFDEITGSDVLALVNQGVRERRTLEFKRELPGGSDKDLKEFLADVTSLANAQGGDLVFGIEDEDGVARAAPGVAILNQDEQLLRLENVVRSGVEPRISGLRMAAVELEPGRGAVLVRVPASSAAPHRVIIKSSSRFFTRNSSGKYEMDTHELRVAFTANEAVPARFRALHRAAVVGATNGTDMPFRIRPEPQAIVTVAPLNLFREVRDLALTPENSLAPVMGTGGGYDWMLTLEGVLIHRPIKEDGVVGSYALTHRTGYVDAAWTIDAFASQVGRRVLATRFEEGVLAMASATQARLRPFGVEGPWVVLTSVARIAGSALSLGGYDRSSATAWRDGATLPQLIVDHIEELALLPIFRSFWLLFGEERPTDRRIG